MRGLQRLFYGPLRPIEIEQLYDKAWFAITETCLAMTIFREEVGGWFLVMFVCLLIGKVWGWIGEGRVEILEQQPPANPRLFHARLSFSLLLSMAFDLFMLNYCVQTVLRQARPNMMVMFAFEFAVLSILSSSTALRYSISLAEAAVIKQQTHIMLEERRAEIRAAREEAQRRAASEGASDQTTPELPREEDVNEMDIDVPGWEEKGRWIFYLDLVTDFFKLVIYLSFFFILVTFYGLPIHIMRDVFLTIRSFHKRISDFLRYRSATKDMNERYPDATVEELERENTCIICREEMRPWQANEPAPGIDGGAPARRATTAMDERLRPKKLPCGHVLHFGCLRSWLERQQVCPTCRRPVLDSNRPRVVPANTPAANNPNNRDQPQGAVPGPDGGHPGNAPQNQARVMNLGPFRIGFGMGRGDVVQDLAQRMNINQPVQPAQAVAPGTRQQVPIGVFPPNQAINGQYNQAIVQAQLHHIEQQLMQELNRMRLASEQLVTVRALQGELARLRIAQAFPTNGPIIPNIINPTMHQNTTLYQYPLPQAYSSEPQRPAMSQGNQNLPEGITLPPGWTLMPLQRIDQSGNPNNATAAQTSPVNPLSQNSDPLPRPASTPAMNSARNRHPHSGLRTASSASGETGPSSSANGPSSQSPSVPASNPSFVWQPPPRSSSQDAPARSSASANTIAVSVNPMNLPAPRARPTAISSSTSPAAPAPAPPATQGQQSHHDTNIASSSAERSYPPPDAVPSWGSSASQNEENSAAESGPSRAESDEHAPTKVFGESSTADTEGSQTREKEKEKGKGRAATVEDFIEDVD
ncbi:MAG: hypothetical protein M1819_004894 [Sarea resinae]|nr:MAG: hypothetical protein M1819_004894 [Sarea resinae]